MGAVQAYLLHEVQRVYRFQGVEINDKHIEIIVRQMLKKVKVEDPGDTELLLGSLVDVSEFEEENVKALEGNGEPATARPTFSALPSFPGDGVILVGSFFPGNYPGAYRCGYQGQD